MANENKDVIRIEEVNKTTLSSKLKTKQLGYTAENVSLGFNSSNGMQWYTADGGDASYHSIAIGELTGIGNRNIGVDASGKLIVYGTSDDIDFSDSDWKFSTDTASSDPTDGYFKVNNSDLSLVTSIMYSAFDNHGEDKSPALEFLQDGNSIYFKDNTDSTKYAMYKVTSVTNNTTWFEVVVTYTSSGSTMFAQDDIANNTFIFELDAGTQDLQSVTDEGATTSNVMSYTTHPTFGGDTQVVDKKYVDDEISVLNLQEVTDKGATTTNDIIVNNGTNQVQTTISKDYINFDGINLLVGQISSGAFGFEYSAMGGNSYAYFGSTGAFKMSRPFTNMEASDIESEVDGKVLVSKEYLEAQGGGSLWEETSGILKPITDPTQLQLGSGYSGGKLDIQVDVSTNIDMIVTGVMDSGGLPWDGNGTYNYVDATTYKHESMDNWIKDTGWFWIICTDQSNPWGSGVGFGSGGRPTPADGASYTGMNGYYGDGGSMLVTESSGSTAEALTTNGKIFSNDVIKSSKSFQVGSKIAIGSDVNGIPTFGVTEVPTNDKSLKFIKNNGANNTELLTFYEDTDLANLPNATIAEIDASTDGTVIATKEWVLASGGSQDLDSVLTEGNDGGGKNITNVPELHLSQNAVVKSTDANLKLECFAGTQIELRTDNQILMTGANMIADNSLIDKKYVDDNSGSTQDFQSVLAEGNIVDDDGFLIKDTSVNDYVSVNGTGVTAQGGSNVSDSHNYVTIEKKKIELSIDSGTGSNNSADIHLEDIAGLHAELSILGQPLELQHEDAIITKGYLDKSIVFDDQTVSGSTTIDYDNGDFVEITLSGNTTLDVSNMVKGEAMVVLVTNSASHTLSFKGVNVDDGSTALYSFTVANIDGSRYMIGTATPVAGVA